MNLGLVWKEFLSSLQGCSIFIFSLSTILIYLLFCPVLSRPIQPTTWYGFPLFTVPVPPRPVFKFPPAKYAKTVPFRPVSNAHRVKPCIYTLGTYDRTIDYSILSSGTKVHHLVSYARVRLASTRYVARVIQLKSMLLVYYPRH